MQKSIRSFLLAFLASLLIGAQSSHAQETWSSSTLPTSQNLWGITFGSGLFVTVGEGGTILTSADGLAWTSRNSGTTQWLLAVTYSADLQRFVVVGDQGTVLTSPDAIAWTARTSGTIQRLNGVAAGPAAASLRLLAVGEAGTVLTSIDGTTWTARTAPTSGWLRGVVYGADRFVLSGQSQAGANSSFTSTVLTTTDGTQFVSNPTGPPASSAPDLEAVAFDGTRLAVAGRSIVALAAPSLPLSWQTKFIEASGLSTPPFRNFRGVTFFNNTWIAVGALSATTGSNSPIVFAQPNSSYQNVPGLALTASFNAVAASSTVAIAVGQGGTVYRSVATPSAPQPFLVSPSTAVIAAVGSAVQITADARGSAPMSYQWNFNNRPISGATQATLTLTNLQLDQSGNYSLSLSNPFGAATSVPYFLTVVSSLAVTAPVDPNFVTPVTAAPSLYVVQPNGKVLVYASTTPVVAGSSPRLDLIRLNSDGSRDPSFHEVNNSSLGSVEVLPNGQILLGTSDGNYLRLNSDGAVDPSFTTVRLARAHRTLADGRLLNLSLANNVATLTRVNSDGSPDPSYAATPVTLAPPSTTGFDPNYTTTFIALDASSRVIVAVASYEQVGTGVFYKNESKIFRILADGTVDPSFPMATVPAGISQFVVTGGKIYYLSTVARALGSQIHYHIGRLNADGSLDASYHAIEIDGGLPVFPNLQLAPDGSVYFYSTGIQSIVHYDTDGARDGEFSARFSGPVTFTRLLSIDGGRLLVSGNFTQLNGFAVSYFARLTPDTHASATRLTNLSVRQLAGDGNQTLIVGFVVSGQGNKPLLLRGVGPTLSVFGVPIPLADPKLWLFESNGTLRLTNDNWSDSADASAIATMGANAGAFALPPGSKDSAALATLAAGAFTAQIGNDGATGVALLEGYDTGGSPPDYSAARVINFSARANTGVAEASIIAGFTITGPNVKRVLVRAIGPALNQFGVTGTLADPQLTLYRNSTAIASNDNWDGNADLAAAFTSTGAFPLSSPTSKDAALLSTLPPGSYTAVVSGVNNTPGVALVEIYEVP